MGEEVIKEFDKKEDSFAKLLGDFGWWQLLVFTTVTAIKVSAGWVQMGIAFLTPNLMYRCTNLPNATQEIHNDTCYADCQEYEYDASPFDNTIVSEWGLICERRWLASFTQTMLQLGVLIGSALFGFMSDRYGRKNTFLTATVLLVASGLGIPYSPSYELFTTLRFIQGAANGGTMMVSFVIIMESVGPKYREIIGCIYHIPYSIGHASLSLFAYFFRSWDKYTLAMAVPHIIYLGYFFVLTESPRWLVSVGRVEDATKIVKKAAIMNNMPTLQIEETLKRLSLELSSKASEPRRNYLDLFRGSLRLKTLCCCFIWMVAGITFYGFSQYVSQTSPDPFLSVALAGSTQIPFFLLTTWLIKRLGRKPVIAGFFLLGGVCAVALALVPPVFALTLTLGAVGVSCGASVSAAIYIFTSELYPTVVRNMGMGASSTSMRVGSMLAPFISNTATTLPWLPTAIFGIAPIGAGLVCLLLPETKGRSLPDSIDEVTNSD